MTSIRPDWDTYFMRVAYLAATRATCDRKHVGALIVDPYHRIIATGYNGAPSGMPSCDEVGHELNDNHCIRSLHAESNAIDFAGRLALGCTLYVTVTPCYDCAKRIIGAGIVHVLWDESYQSRYGKTTQAEFLASAGVKTTQFELGRMEKFRKLLNAADAPGPVLDGVDDALIEVRAHDVEHDAGEGREAVKRLAKVVATLEHNIRCKDRQVEAQYSHLRQLQGRPL